MLDIVYYTWNPLVAFQSLNEDRARAPAAPAFVFSLARFDWVKTDHFVSDRDSGRDKICEYFIEK